MTRRTGAAEPAPDTWPSRITRAFALDDVAVRPGRIHCDTCGRDATGRVVDAYAGVFNQETEIVEDDGRRYIESIDPAAWNKRLTDLSRGRSGVAAVSVFYHHGKTLYDTPSESGSHVLGHPLAIRSDHYGLLTSTHYGTTPHADSVFTDLVEGNVRGHSFTGRIFRSDPDRVPRATRGASLPKVRRQELGLDEYGPTPMPFYAGADTVAVRGGSQPEPAAVVAGSQADIARKIRTARELGRV